MKRFLGAIFIMLWGIKIAAALEFADLQNERLNFEMVFKGLDAVNAEMWLEHNDSTTMLHWRLDTKPVVQFLFRVNNSYLVILDANGRMIETRKTVNQKNIQQDWTIKYDFDAKRAFSNHDFDWPIVDNCMNVLALLYDMRTRNIVNGDSLNYILDIESQIWQVDGVVQSVMEDGNFIAHEIVYSFSPALDIFERAWKTDIVTNRMGRHNSTLTIRLGPAPDFKPLLVRFGNKKTEIEMRLRN